MPRRPVLFATLAVALVGAAGATSVFLVGSKQRRDDRRRLGLDLSPQISDPAATRAI